MPIYDEDTGTYWRSEDDGGDLVQVWQDDDGWTTVNPNPQLVYDEDSGTWGTVGVPNSPYLDALQQYSSGKTPWNYTNVYEGLSNRQPFNLNALWGGSQYATGRVSDFSHLDPTQLQANQIAGQTRDELWRVYDDLKAKGQAPAKNPDQIALEFYTQNIGQEGNTYGYGPGANTALLAESLKSQFLNQPEVVAQTKTVYQPTQEALIKAEAFGASHQGGVPTWQVFEQQGQSSDWFSKLIPAIIGTIAFPGLSAAFGGGILGGAGAGALIGGTTAEMGGGDFLKGALSGGIGGALKGGLSVPDTGYVAEVSPEAWAAEDLASNIASAPAYIAEVSPEAWALEDLASGIADPSSPYYDLGYTPQEILQIQSGTYAGPEQSILDVQEQMGNLYDVAYPDGFPTSSSAYEGLGYTAQDISDLYEGTYSGPEQDIDTVREQMGDLYETAYPDTVETYDPSTVSSKESSSINKELVKSALGSAAKLADLQRSINIQRDAANYEDAMNSLANMSQQPQGGGIGIKGTLAPQMIGGRAETSPIADYAAIIPKLAGILNQRGYKVGGQVNDPSYVAGPEGKLYASHPVRGFAVGGPGTGQSDDIPTMLSDGEYVIDADTVAALGDGSSKAGAEILDKFRQEIRSHKRSAPADKIPPKAKNPLAYLKSAKKSKG